MPVHDTASGPSDLEAATPRIPQLPATPKAGAAIVHPHDLSKSQKTMIITSPDCVRHLPRKTNPRPPEPPLPPRPVTLEKVARVAAGAAAPRGPFELE